VPNSYFYKHQAGSIRGIPDIVGSVGGIAVFLELKRHRKALARPLQKYILDKITSTGALALIVSPETWAYVYTALVKIGHEGKEHVQNHIQRIAKSELHASHVEGRKLH